MAFNKRRPNYRKWVWTDFKMDKSIDDMFDNSTANIIMWANEICPDTGRKHRQARGTFKNPISRNMLQDIVGHKCHAEPEQDTPKSIGYCNGSDPEKKYFAEPESRGAEVSQGQRTDIENLAEAVKEGKGDLYLFENHTKEAYKYQNGIRAHRKALDKKPKFEAKEVYIISGPPGVGKSHFPDCHYGEEKTYHLSKAMWDSGYWEGYDAQEHDVIVLDGFNGAWMKFTELENFLDGYPIRVNQKYGGMWARYRVIVLTSNEKPQQWYGTLFSTKKDLYQAIKRRVTNYMWMDKPYVCHHRPAVKTPGTAVPKLG